MLNSTGDLLNVLNNHSIDSEGSFLVSFDVVSLFTNIPLSESIELATDYVYDDENTNQPPFSREIFKKLLVFATGGIFSFNGNYYKQIDGVTMGSPLGPTLANLFLANLEKNWLSLNHSPLLYRRYVDDIICIFDDNNNYLEFFNFINSQHPNLKFTCELGNKELPFLDVKVVMKDIEFETSIYRKDTYTGLLLNYSAMCPLIWKKGLVLGLLTRAYTACSNWKLFHEEIQNICKFLCENNYPKSFVENIISNFLHNKFNNSQRDDSIESVRYTFKIPYIGNPSLVLKKKLRKLFKKCEIDVNIVFSTSKVSSYFSLKDRTNPALKASVIYQFSCLDDPSCSYIGKTKRHLQIRIGEHLKGPSAIFGHISKCQVCQNNSNNNNQFKCIQSGNSDFELQILEALYILQNRPSLNVQLAKGGTSYNLNIF